MFKISVIIPCYNVEHLIDRCMKSIMVQTIGKENLEIICIDDASTDNTWERLQVWEQRYPENIMLIHQESNGKQGTARNIALQYASAEWVAFVDADDWLEPDYLEQLYAPVTRFDCDVVSCSWWPDKSESLVYLEEKNRQKGEEHYIVADSEEITGQLFEYRPLGEGPVAKLLNTKWLKDNQILFPEGVAYEDHYWIPLLYLYVKKAYITGKNLYHYYLNPDSTSRSKNQEYHVDWMTVQLMKWAEYKRRGLWQKYCEMMEGDALIDAAGFVKMLVLRYDEPSFSLFMLESELIKQIVPNYKGNRYIANLSEISHIYLEALYHPMNKAIFQQFVRECRKYYGFH